MRRSEHAIEQYLDTLGLGAVRFEPDGNVPPDFVVGGRIAVEARRLNQHEYAGGVLRGLEVTATPLQAAVTKILREQGPPPDGASWFVFYAFRRPLPPWRELERRLRAAISEFMERPHAQSHEMQIAPGFRLEFLPASAAHEWWFVHGGSIDHDSGGFTVAELIENISICLAEKTLKVAPYLQRYSEWWLAFEDTIALADLDTDELAELKQHLPSHHPFSRVVLVSPVAPHKGIDIIAKSA